MRASVERPSKKQVGTRRAPYTAPTYLAKARHGRRCGGPNTSPIHLKRDGCATRPHMKREIGLCNGASQIMTFPWNTGPILAVKSFGAIDRTRNRHLGGPLYDVSRVKSCKIDEPPQVPAGGRRDRRRNGRDAAGLARADGYLEVSVDLADAGHI